MDHRRLTFSGALLLGLVAATTGVAQERTARQFSVTPSVGIMSWDESSGLAMKKAASDGRFTDTRYNPTVGVAVDYAIAGPMAVGFYLHAARPTTRGDYFPSVLFDYGARSEVYAVSQRVTALMYGLQGTLDLELGQFSPFVSVGGGATSVTLDPQQNDGNRTFTNGHLQFGGGLGFRLGRSAVIRADVRDFVFLNWDRDELNPVGTTFQNTRLPAVNTSVPPEERTIHNLRFVVGFSFVPSRPEEPRAP